MTDEDFACRLRRAKRFSFLTDKGNLKAEGTMPKKKIYLKHPFSDDVVRVRIGDHMNRNALEDFIRNETELSPRYSFSLMDENGFSIPFLWSELEDRRTYRLKLRKRPNENMDVCPLVVSLSINSPAGVQFGDLSSSNNVSEEAADVIIPIEPVRRKRKKASNAGSAASTPALAEDNTEEPKRKSARTEAAPCSSEGPVTEESQDASSHVTSMENERNHSSTKPHQVPPSYTPLRGSFHADQRSPSSSDSTATPASSPLSSVLFPPCTPEPGCISLSPENAPGPTPQPSLQPRPRRVLARAAAKSKPCDSPPLVKVKWARPRKGKDPENSEDASPSLIPPRSMDCLSDDSDAPFSSDSSSSSSENDYCSMRLPRAQVASPNISPLESETEEPTEASELSSVATGNAANPSGAGDASGLLEQPIAETDPLVHTAASSVCQPKKKRKSSVSDTSRNPESAQSIDHPVVSVPVTIEANESEKPSRAKKRQSSKTSVPAPKPSSQSTSGSTVSAGRKDLRRAEGLSEDEVYSPRVVLEAVGGALNDDTVPAESPKLSNGTCPPVEGNSAVAESQPPPRSTQHSVGKSDRKKNPVKTPSVTNKSSSASGPVEETASKDSATKKATTDRPTKVDPGIQWLHPCEFVAETAFAPVRDLKEDFDENFYENPQAKQNDTMTVYNTVSWLQIGKEHPEFLAEAQTLAAVLPRVPDSDFVVRVPAPVVHMGLISNPQLESVVLACQSFDRRLPSGHKQGFILGDGTGCGKGRIIACCILHLWNHGYRRHVWVSISSDLAKDAARDLKDVGASHIPVIDLRSIPACDLDSPAGQEALKTRSARLGWEWNGEGVLFLTYCLTSRRPVGQLPKSAAKKKAWPTGSPAIAPADAMSRVDQVILWMQNDRRKDDRCKSQPSVSSARLRTIPKELRQYARWCPKTIYPGGLLAFDEAHKAKNFQPALNQLRGSIVGSAVERLQDTLRDCPVLYASATAASEPRNMAYMSRLGLWGENAMFNSFNHFKSRIEMGKVAAMECLAMDLKSFGLYTCRSLSFSDIDFNTIVVPSSPQFVEMYTAFVRIMQRLRRVLLALSADPRVILGKNKRMTSAQFWSVAQRCFKYLLVSQKVDECVKMVKRFLAEGHQVVVSLWGTGDAAAQDKMKSVKETGESVDTGLDDFLSTPSIMVENLIKSYINYDVDTSKEPTSQVDPNEYRQQLTEMLNTVENHLELPSNSLDKIITDLGGPSKVAEMSGRSRRLEMCKDGRVRFNLRAASIGESTSAQKGLNSVNIKEQEMFQQGKKKVAVITEAASAGISLHCDKTLPVHAKRIMICLELPWAADKAVQQFGRVHRSNQKCPPSYYLLVSDAGGERRFVACIARRLKSLGALTRGDRYAQFASASRNSAGDLDEDSEDSLLHLDLYSKYGTTSLTQMIRWLKNERGSLDLPVPASVQCGLFPSAEAFSGSMLQELELAGFEFGLLKKEKIDGAERMMNHFLNRVLLMPLELQAHIFQFFFEIHDRMVRVSKDNGEYDVGVENLHSSIGCDRRIIMKRCDPVWCSPLTGAVTRYFCLLVDRGITFEQSEAAFAARPADRADFEGYYLNRYRGASKLSVALVFQRKTLRNDGPPFIAVWRPSFGVSVVNARRQWTLPGLLDAGWFQASPEQVRSGLVKRLWTSIYAATANHCMHHFLYGRCNNPNCRSGKRISEAHLLTGNIIMLWNRLEDWMSSSPTDDQGEDGQHSDAVHQTPTTRSLRLTKAFVGSSPIVGARIPPGKIHAIRSHLGSACELTPVSMEKFYAAQILMCRNNAPTRLFQFLREQAQRAGEGSRLTADRLHAILHAAIETKPGDTGVHMDIKVPADMEHARLLEELGRDLMTCIRVLFPPSVRGVRHFEEFLSQAGGEMGGFNVIFPMGSDPLFDVEWKDPDAFTAEDVRRLNASKAWLSIYEKRGTYELARLSAVKEAESAAQTPGKSGSQHLPLPLPPMPPTPSSAQRMAHAVAAEVGLPHSAASNDRFMVQADGPPMPAGGSKEVVWVCESDDDADDATVDPDPPYEWCESADDVICVDSDDD